MYTIGPISDKCIAICAVAMAQGSLLCMERVVKKRKKNTCGYVWRGCIIKPIYKNTTMCLDFKNDFCVCSLYLIIKKTPTHFEGKLNICVLREKRIYRPMCFQVLVNALDIIIHGKGNHIFIVYFYPIKKCVT